MQPIIPQSPSFHSVSEEMEEDESTGIGLSDSSLNYAVRRMFEVMKKLHNTGVQIDIDLPQIAVIGNQSAGKSSLIEAVSGITLPRASGTCTRCPTECHLTRTDEKWQCVVSLRLTTDVNGNPLGQAKNVRFGDVIYDKSEVEDRIRRAQRAILNPNINSEKFLLDDDPTVKGLLHNQLSFSLNCITLSISGPDVADLSFCDLPGLIASVGNGGNVASIALVNKMVETYIEKPSCIILLTVACETDFENQGAHSLAKKHDPEGKRTIGVLTKPDRIPQGEESSWIPFIRDEKEPLENNWFCVKLPSSHELRMELSWAETRRLEEDFFVKKSSPWAEVEEPYRKYLGTTNLVERLSTVLSDLISTRVPQIQDELERSIANTREQISRLPPPPSADPRSEILNLLHTFVQNVTQHVKGVPELAGSNSLTGLIQSIRPEQHKFKRSIRGTAPEFWPFEKGTTNPGRLLHAHFLLSEEGDEFMEPSFARNSLPTKIYIDEVSAQIPKAITRELPGHVPYNIIEEYIRTFIKQWDVPSEALIKAVHDIIVKHLKQMVHDHFWQFGHGKLEQQVRAIVQGHISACLARAEAGVKYQWRLEQNCPFTLSPHHLTDYKKKFLALYQSAHEEQRKAKKDGPSVTSPPHPFTTPNSFAFNNTNVKQDTWTKSATGTTSAAPGFTPATPTFSSAPTSGNFKPTGEKLAFNFPPNASGFSTSSSSSTPVQDNSTTGNDPSSDPMEPALVIMANVRAYFQVAYKRFIDNVSSAIDLELVTGLAEDLWPTLVSQLCINGPNGDKICKEFAQESPKIANRRLELTKKLERLEAGHNELFAAFV
ncbi:Interferon-induced GTP-binding protein Mx [Psilocybe cubensis]|uniref:Uncharacterized protein n=2 Tax=Psilocybe cubensis TaxID=181762 RepID=A0A8H7XTX9_PSICU|nr:Interferon-induced GTP-binding protein Mx [Psilocybe cubensis]KAH9474809.1 Interferon-induced GTP-binding protein Mx [Psilocybe cubensis]